MAVYFIQTEGENAIKIGYAREPQKRRAELQTGHHEALTVVGVIARGDMALERRLHERFAKSHIRGEWFRPTEELLGFIEGVRACEDVPPDALEPKVVHVADETWKLHQWARIHRAINTITTLLAPFYGSNIQQSPHSLLRLIVSRKHVLDEIWYISHIEHIHREARVALKEANRFGFEWDIEVESAVESPHWEIIDPVVMASVALCDDLLKRCAEFNQVAILDVRDACGNRCVYCRDVQPRYLIGRCGWPRPDDGDLTCSMLVLCVSCLFVLSVDRWSASDYIIDLDGRDESIVPTNPSSLETPPNGRVSFGWGSA